jgi:hypothetical protein
MEKNNSGAPQIRHCMVAKLLYCFCVYYVYGNPRYAQKDTIVSVRAKAETSGTKSFKHCLGNSFKCDVLQRISLCKKEDR